MEAVFTLPYSEYQTIIEFQRYFKKKDNYSILVPTSRQQKGLDFLVLNTRRNKSLRVQVKSSRSWNGKDNLSVKAKNKGNKFLVNFWFNNFIDRYNKDDIDYFVLFGIYPDYQVGNKVTSKDKVWKNIILVFNKTEMYRLLKEAKTKKEGKKDLFFGLGFDSVKEIYTTRGFNERKLVNDHLLKNKIPEMINSIS